MPEGLKIVVGADVQEAVQKVKALENTVDSSFTNIASKVSGSGKSFNTFADGAKAAGDAIKKTKTQINIFEGSIETLQARIGARKSFLNTETDIKKIAQLNKEISLLELQVSHLSNIGRTKFDQFGQAVTRTSAASRSAAIGITAASFSMENLGKGAQKALAGILRLSYILPGIGTAGIIGGILTVAGALVGLGGNAQQTAANFGPLAEQLKITKDAQKEFSDQADKAAQSVLAQADNLADLKTILLSVTNETANLTKATINQGVAQFLFDKKNLAVQKLLSAEIEQQIELRNQQRPLATLKRFTLEGESKNPFIKKVAEAKDAVRQINDLSFGLDDLFKKIFEKPVTTKEVKVKPEKVSIRPPLGSIDLELPTAFDPAEKSKIQTQIDKIFQSLNTKLEIPVKSLSLNLSAGALANNKLIADMRKLGEDTAAAFNDGLQNALSQGLSGIGEVLGATLSGGGIGDAFKAFAASIGDALQAMGKQIIGIGVAALLAKQALKTLFANPATAILAGTALVAAGAALKSVLSGGIRGFAAGGIVSGPTLALIGEGSGTSRSNPEVVAPLDQLKGMLQGMGGSGDIVIINRRIRGRDQVLQASRERSSQRRTTGR